MARIVTTARGEKVDFDALLIKQQLAQAPMNIEVERRKQFIDSKEGKAPKQAVLQPQPAMAVAPPEVQRTAPGSFELDEVEPIAQKPAVDTKAVKK